MKPGPEIFHIIKNIDTLGLWDQSIIWSNYYSSVSFRKLDNPRDFRLGAVSY